MGVPDTILRGGTIVDGTGAAPFCADVAISDGLISRVGSVAHSAAREIDARGLLVTPGFVDIHTHYDGQVTWENRTSPSCSHGVTTVLMGNCGVGFAPCRPNDREMLVHLMEGIEDIPQAVMAEGLPWNWETFPQYLNSIEARPRDIDVATQLPHSCLRVFVMGERGANGAPATSEELSAMTLLAEEAMRAGALGFGTSRTLFHRSSDGLQVPTKNAHEAELDAIALGMKRAGHGVIQAVLEMLTSDTLVSEVEMLGRVARRSGRPASFSLVQMPGSGRAWRDALAATARLKKSGVTLRAQTFCRPNGVLLGLQLSYSPFSRQASYREIADLALADKLRELRDPNRRARILAEPPTGEGIAHLDYLSKFDRMFELGDPPNYEPSLNAAIGARAARANTSPQEFVYELLLQNEGKTILFLAFANYEAGNLDAVGEMLTDPNAVWGLGDGGAHYGMICDSSYTTFLLTHWTRDRVVGEKLKLSEVVHGLTQNPAEAIGLLDRGVIAAGYKADINLIDYEHLRLHAPRVVRDLPSGGRRLVQDAQGYVATFVNGVAIQRQARVTGALPGRLIRGPKGAPATR